jgi:hypothetical protein
MFCSIGCLPLLDQHRVDNDFTELKNLLNVIYFSTMEERKSYIVRFEDKRADLFTFENKFIRSLPLPTLNEVNYDTTLGNNMIVFRPGGTHEYNKRVHGGDVRLKSWFGYSRSIAVNCNGFVKEGIYPDGD